MTHFHLSTSYRYRYVDNHLSLRLFSNPQLLVKAFRSSEIGYILKLRSLIKIVISCASTSFLKRILSELRRFSAVLIRNTTYYELMEETRQLRVYLWTKLHTLMYNATHQRPKGTFNRHSYLIRNFLDLPVMALFIT